MIPNEQGVPEPPQRVHWDNAFTQRLLGLPGAYDLGPERCSWLIQGVTDWMGDDGLLTQDRSAVPQVQLHGRRHLGARAR